MSLLKHPRLVWTRDMRPGGGTRFAKARLAYSVGGSGHCATITAQQTYVEPRRQSTQFTSHFESITLRSV